MAEADTASGAASCGGVAVVVVVVRGCRVSVVLSKAKTTSNENDGRARSKRLVVLGVVVEVVVVERACNADN